MIKSNQGGGIKGILTEEGMPFVLQDEQEFAKYSDREKEVQKETRVCENLHEQAWRIRKWKFLGVSGV